ncbi:MAG: hypothetical protein ABW034_00455 [Steroidobacteraceae bacterium]
MHRAYRRIDDELINPHRLSDEVDLPHRPVALANWTEHYVFFGYDDTHQFGIFLHIGRLPEEPQVWRSVLQIYLPGEDLLVLKSYGHGDPRGPGAGPLQARCIDPFRLWTVDFEGAAFSTTRRILTHEIVRDGPAELVRFHMVFEAAGPFHTLTPGKELTTGMTVASFHSSQVMHMRGTAAYRGKRISLNGVGVRDHSDGPRDYGPVYGDMWCHALFPSGKVLHLQEVSFENHLYQSGYIFRGDGSPMEMIELLDVPHCCNPDTPEHSIDPDPLTGPDRQFRAVIRTKAGDETLEGDLLHSHAITYFAVMEEFIGTALDRRGGIQMCDAPMRVRCCGEVGLGLRERAARTEALMIPPRR